MKMTKKNDKKIFVYSVLVFFAVIFSGYILIFNLVKDEIYQVRYIAASNVRERLDAEITKIKDCSGQLGYSYWVKKYAREKFLNKEQFIKNDSDISEYLKDLNNYKQQNGFIREYALYFNDSDIVLSSSKNIDNLNDFFTFAYRSDLMTIESWKNILNQVNSDNVMFLKNVYGYFGVSDMMCVINTVFTESPYYDGKVRATLITFIDDDNIKDILKTSQLDENSSSILVDSQNQVLLNLNTNENLLKTDVLNKIINSKNINGNIVIVEKSEKMGCEIITITPQLNIVISVFLKKFIIIVLIILILFTVVFMSYYFINKYYKTLRETSKRYLNKTNMIKMLENEERFIDIDDSFKKDKNKFASLVISIKHPNKMEEYLRIINMLLKSYNQIDGITIDRISEVVVMIGAENEENIRTFIVDLVDELNNNYKEKFLCVGGIHDSISQLSQSYKEAQYTREFKRVVDDNGAIFYNEIISNNNLEYYYPIEYEKKIYSLMEIGNIEESLMLLDGIIKKNTDENNISFISAKCLYYDILSTLLKIVNKRRLNDRLGDVNKEFFELSDLNQMKKFIEDLFRKIGDLIKQDKESSNVKLRDDIIGYIDDNYNDENISLIIISEKFNVSPSYISRYIKDQLGIGFSEYLREIRIRKAKELLPEAKNIFEVAIKVGYTNDKIFRESFKKVEGMTPSEYRLSLKKDIL